MIASTGMGFSSGPDGVVLHGRNRLKLTLDEVGCRGDCVPASGLRVHKGGFDREIRRLTDSSGSGMIHENSEGMDFHPAIHFCRRIGDDDHQQDQDEGSRDEVQRFREFYEALDKKVLELIKDAEKRAMENGRKTVRPCDL